VLAALLIFGYRVWPGILLGSLITNATIGDGFHLNGLAVTIAVGSTVQALIGEFALRRVDARMELDHPLAVGRFVAVTLLTCLVAASVGNAGLVTVGFVSLEQLPRSFITWWLGDTLGVLIFLPLVLVLVDPRPQWRHRRLQVGVPLFAAFVLCTLVYQVVRHDEERRLIEEFRVEADPFIAELSDFNVAYSRAMTAGAGLFGQVKAPSALMFSRWAGVFLQNYPLISVVEWVPLLRQEDLSRFQIDLAPQMTRQMVVRPIASHAFAADGWIAPVTFIEPLVGNEEALGRDLLSEPLRAAAVRKAWHSGKISATAKISLVQDPEGPGGVLLLAPIQTPERQVRGFLLGVVNLRGVTRSLQTTRDIAWSLRDVAAGTVVDQTLTDAPEFSGSSRLDRRGVYLKRLLRLADRELTITLYKPHAAFVTQAVSLASLVLLMSLVISAGLGIFALVVSGSAGRIAREVAERTSELRESEARYERAVTGSKDGIWDWNVVTGEDYLSPRWKEMIGYEDHELLNTAESFFGLLHPEDAPKVQEAVRAHFEERKPYEIEMRLRCKNGDYRWVRAHGQATWNEQGQAVRMAGSISDISERRRIEQIKAEFVSTVSHELRTPLTSISGSLSLLLGGALGEAPRAMQPMLEIAHKNTLRLVHLINDLLDIEKLAAGKVNFAFELLPLMPLIEQAIESTRVIGEQVGVALEQTERVDHVQVRVDRIRLQQVLGNFLSNAIKFSPPGAPVVIKASRHDHLVRVEISDRGPGVPAEFRTRIFQKFSQADSSDARQQAGTGLGLAISKELIERMNGRVGFTSEPGRGACFYFELPVVEAAMPSTLSGV
jgi:PAS domain S-box-containing protein